MSQHLKQVPTFGADARKTNARSVLANQAPLGSYSDETCHLDTRKRDGACSENLGCPATYHKSLGVTVLLVPQHSVQI